MVDEIASDILCGRYTGTGVFAISCSQSICARCDSSLDKIGFHAGISPGSGMQVCNKGRASNAEQYWAANGFKALAQKQHTIMLSTHRTNKSRLAMLQNRRCCAANCLQSSHFNTCRLTCSIMEIVRTRTFNSIHRSVLEPVMCAIVSTTVVEALSQQITRLIGALLWHQDQDLLTC